MKSNKPGVNPYEQIAGETAKISKSNVKMHGRYAEEGGTLYSSQPASGIEIRFKGTELAVSLTASEDAYVHVFIDNNYELYFDYEDDNIILLDKGESELVVAENHPYGVHTVKILKANEGAYNKIGWGEASTDGALMAPPDANGKKYNL